ncbi:MAG: diadenylate cyclase CdaA [Leptospiraceae bacterium]|nr:diadenylate cyclase CdaA [Leptospiraceae bacterium]MDW7976627.1 diadenylate cyclase CdaA [Leptospiraceae bacterium]
MEEKFRFFFIFLDISLVAFFFYKIYVLLSRTRAIQLLFVILLIIVFDFFSKEFQLETVSWIIRNLSAYLVFGVIVLLQPELRRLVGEIGNMPLFTWLSSKEVSSLEVITQAVIELSRSKVGSIICIIQDIKPDYIIKKGVKLDAIITKELLLSIFYKENPLHDGAVLIEKDRIIAASCILPVSESPLLKPYHGARHRAAMGMAEETDAIVIVTSEETGEISILYNGEILSPIPKDELKTKILELIKK